MNPAGRCKNPVTSRDTCPHDAARHNEHKGVGDIGPPDDDRHKRRNGAVEDICPPDDDRHKRRKPDSGTWMDDEYPHSVSIGY